jgi:hypothetical protein
VIAMLAKNVPVMFKDKHVIAKMKAGGSPLHIMTRDQVEKMFHARQKYLEALLKELRKKK